MLGLAGFGITSALCGLAPNLETLVLEGLGVTDAGVASLSKLAHLKKLTIHEPKVTEAGLNRLRAALPAVDVAR